MPKQTYFNLPEHKRKLILECAVNEFAEYGYHAASISRIVAAAGIAKGSFYQYFEDKEDIYGQVVEHSIIRRKLRISSEESVKLKELNLTQFMRVLFNAILSSFISEPKLLKISVDYMRNQFDPVQKRIFEKYKYLQDDYFQKFIRIEKERGEIDPMVDEDVLGNMLIGLGYLINRHIMERGSEKVSQQYIDSIMNKIEYILVNGIYKNTK